MKIREEYVLQKIAGKWIVIDTNSKSVNFNRILSLNDSGKLLWDILESGAEYGDLVGALSERFGIGKELAEKDAEKFVRELKELGCIEDED